MNHLARRSLDVVASAAMLVALSAPASADIISGTIQVHGGGAGGQGINGDRKDDAFSEGAAGASYGVLVGVELVFIDIMIGHDQYVTDGLVGTWTMLPYLGIDTEFDLSRPTAGATRTKDGQLKGGYSRWFSELGFGVGFGVGTGQQIDPPLDNAEITDKGMLFRTTFGLGYRLSKQLSVGAMVPIEARYMFKSEEGDTVNDKGTHYQSLSAALLLNLRFSLQLY